MTCIVAIQTNNKVFMGGDSCGLAGYSVQVRMDEKVFKNGPFLIGFTTSFRMGQLLRYALKAPKHKDGVSDLQYMVTSFVDAVRDTLKHGGFQKKSGGSESGGQFLVGYRGKLYELDDDYQVAVHHSGMSSVGSGSEVAIGAMHALENLDPIPRIQKSLEIAEKLNSGVRGPFIILESTDEEQS